MKVRIYSSRPNAQGFLAGAEAFHLSILPELCAPGVFVLCQD
jgi:hypothetical protein